jgi:hypothetical protein
MEVGQGLNGAVAPKGKKKYFKPSHLRSSSKTLYVFKIPLMRATCTVRLIRNNLTP